MSFLIPVKNISFHFETLRNQVEENYLDGDEVIVVDDHSTDTTPQLLKSWGKSSSYVNVVRNSGTSGLTPSLNLGLAHSTKDWIARFDADDLYSKKRILIQSSYISEGTVAVFSDYNFISKNGTFLGNVPTGIYPLQTSLSLVSGNRTAHPSVIFNRLAAIEAGAYRNQDYLAEDLSLWLRMSRLGQLRSVPEVLLFYRLNPASVTLNSRSESRLKCQTVLSEIGLNQIDIENSLNSLESLQLMYGEDNSSFIRQLLFLRDAQKSLQYTSTRSRSNIERLIKKNLVGSYLKSAPFVLQKITEKAIRDIYRKSFSISNY